MARLDLLIERLYAENGDEDKARVVLEQARAIDNFNVATGNYLTLLDEIVPDSHHFAANQQRGEQKRASHGATF